jgi:pilus retraction protein PilT
VAFGEKTVMRLLDPEVIFQDLNELGFSRRDAVVFNSFTSAPHGLVFVTGPTGSGKSTTLYSTLKKIATPEKNIVTIEDPVEMVYEEFNQIAVQPLIDVTFSTILRNILRQDPDIIMIGEMRDALSFMAAMSAADTGHTVFSTVHTTNASQSVTRILDFFQSEEREQVRRQLAACLKAVICQRMVRTVSGGMTPAIEIMINTQTVRKMIEENRLDKLAAAIETGTDDGMMNFNQSLFKLVQAGKVNKEEALAKATNPQALEMNFKGIFLSEGKRILG